MINISFFINKTQPGLRFALIIVLLMIAVIQDCAAQAEPANGEYKTVSYSLEQLLGKEAAAGLKKIMPVDKELSWKIFIPEKVNENPPGVLVYISPVKSAELDQDWAATLNQQNMIYIAAHDSGNETLVNRRMLMGLMALTVLKKTINYDKTQVFISGFSGGGRVASMLAGQYPAIFKGGLYICGVNKLSKRQNSKLNQLKENRYVFLTGSGDFNRNETRSIYRNYKRAGIEESKLMIIQGLSHEHPNADQFNQAIIFLKQGGL